MRQPRLKVKRDRERERIGPWEYCLAYPHPILSGYWLEADKKGALELIGLEVVVADNIWTEPDIWESPKIAPFHMELLERQQKVGLAGTTRGRSRGLAAVKILNIQTLLSNQVAPQPTWRLEIGVWGIGRGWGGGFGLCSRGSLRSFGRESEGRDPESDVWVRTLTTFPPHRSNLRHPSLKSCRRRGQVLEVAHVSVNTKPWEEAISAKSI